MEHASGFEANRAYLAVGGRWARRRPDFLFRPLARDLVVRRVNVQAEAAGARIRLGALGDREGVEAMYCGRGAFRARIQSRCTLLAVVLLMASSTIGCSVLGTIQYYAPSTTEGIARHEVAFHDILKSGPGNVLVLRRAGGNIRIQAVAYNGWSVLAGPLFFPVIPYIMPDFNLDSDIPWNEPGITIEVSFPIWPEDLDADLEKSFVTLQGEREARPARLGVRMNVDSVHQMTFQGIDKKEGRTFDLTLGEIRIAGEPLSLPRVRFTKSRGWSWILIP